MDRGCSAQSGRNAYLFPLPAFCQLTHFRHRGHSLIFPVVSSILRYFYLLHQSSPRRFRGFYVEFEHEGNEAEPANNASSSSATNEGKADEETEAQSIEEAIKDRLKNFFEKRRASGDARPCGPHDMAPIYLAVFGIGKEELKNEKFWGRLGRPRQCDAEKGKEKEMGCE